MSRLSVTVSALALIGALASNPAEAVQRAFVASFGSDANTAANCTFANPCRGFAAAMTVVDSGGEVVALDAAGYGAVTITKSVTLTANPGFYAGIAASTGNAVTIATASVNVILRGLNINGVGAVNGVIMTNGSGLSIENCVISNFSTDGVNVDVNASSATVRVVNTLVRGNGGMGLWFQGGVTASVSNSTILGNGLAGVFVDPASGGVANVAVSGTVSSGNSWGFDAGPGGNLSVIHSTASGNLYTGLQNEGGVVSVGYSMASNNGLYGLRNLSGTLESLGNNVVRQNPTANTAGTITAVSGL